MQQFLSARNLFVKFAKLTSHTQLMMLKYHMCSAADASNSIQYYLKRNCLWFTMCARFRSQNSSFLKFLCNTLKRRFLVGRRDVAYVAATVMAYNWDTYRIPDDEIRRHTNEMDYVKLLKENTVCHSCYCTGTLDRDTDDGCECQCERIRQLKNPAVDDWKLFIVRGDIIVWRRLHSSGQYEYKVYGYYADVNAEDFLNVQLDLEYRKKWDTTVIQLEVVESDPVMASNSDVIYWEMLWPKFFINRDYVFNRRFSMDNQNKLLFMLSRCTEHPMCPANDDKYRVKDYWSCMVIKPVTDVDKPGIEFSLTYFDNPGINMPSSVSAWVATKAMPEFLDRLRDATRSYQAYCQQEGVSLICKFQRNDAVNTRSTHTPYFDYFDPDIVTDNTIFEPQHTVTKTKQREPDSQPPNRNQFDTLYVSDNSASEKGDVKNSHNAPCDSTVQTTSKFSWWKYTLLKNYIS